MALRGRKPSGAGEVTVASPPGGAPRLDFSRFSAFGFQDDASKSALPRSKSSSHIFHTTRKNSSIDDDDDDTYPLDVRGFRPRSDCDREGLGHLIEFLRSTSPPPQNYLPSAFDDDGEPTEERGRWRQLKRKLRLPRMKSASNPGEGHVRYMVYEPAVASRTSEGHRHMAISVPIEHCHLGPDSDWAVAAFNATKPLPPSPPPEDRKMTFKTRTGSASGQGRKGSVPEVDSGDDDLISMKPASSMPRLQNKDSQASIHLWQRNLPLSPPHSPPPRTAPGDVQRPFASGPMQPPRAHLPMDIDSYVELPGSPSSSPSRGPRTPKTPESVEDRMRNVHVSWLKTTQVLQSAPGPPPRSAPHPAPYSSFHPARPETSPTKPLPKRPDNLKLPVRKSSLKNPGLSNMRAQSRPSLDGVLASQKRRDRLSTTLVEKPEPSPTAQSDHSVASSIVTQESEPVIASARAWRGYSNTSTVLQSTPGTTPRASLIMLTPDKTLSVISAGEDKISSTRTQRKASTRTNASRKSRAERVKSLKQRDMEAARSRLQMLHQAEQQTDDADMVARPHTAETVISTLRLPSREGGQDTPSVSSFAEFFPRPPTAEDTRASYRRDSGVLSPSRSRNHCSESGVEQDPGRLAPGPAASARESFCSSQGARRHDSYQRTSWASSIPLLDRISSYAPSEASFMQILDSAAPASNPHRRSDSATLPRIEQERLAPSRLSLVPSVNMEGMESGCPSQRQSTIGVPGGSGPGLEARFSMCLPATTHRPCTPPNKRWSGTTTHFSETPAAASSPLTSIAASLKADRTSAELTPPASRRGSPTESNAHGCEAVSSEGTTIMCLHLEEDQQPEEAQPSHEATMYIPRGAWANGTVQDVTVEMESCSSAPAHSTRFDGSVQKRGSHPLLRSRRSSELRAHYASLHRLGCASTLARQMLLNQERMELDICRSEQNQILFVRRVEQVLENLGHGRPLSGTPRASLGWKEQEGAVDERRHACQPILASRGGRVRIAEESDSEADETRGRRRPREPRGSRTRNRHSRHERQRHDRLYGSAGTNGELEAMDPLMRELQNASRVSLESTRDQQHQDASGNGGSPAAIGGRELDAYFNMI